MRCPPAFLLLHHHLCHVLDALCSVVLVMDLSRHVLQVLHVRSHQHVPQHQEVRVSRVLHWPGDIGMSVWIVLVGGQLTDWMWMYCTSYLQPHPRDKVDPWLCDLCSPLEHYFRLAQMECFPEKKKRNKCAVTSGVDGSPNVGKWGENLQNLVLPLELFLFIRITLRELVDVDPKPLYLLSHLERRTHREDEQTPSIRVL